MALDSLALLDMYKAQPFVPGYPAEERTFYSPVDQVHLALHATLAAANKSIHGGMFGFDDPDLAKTIRNQLVAAHIYVQISLDRSQKAAKTETEILAEWMHEEIGNSISFGTSEKGAIMHLKLFVVDGLDVITGSTNWSLSGETLQDNQLTILRNPFVAAEATARLSIIHDSQLKQMAKRAAAPA